MIKINLMPPEEKKDSGPKVSLQLPANITNILLGIPPVIALVLAVGLYLHYEGVIKEKTAEQEKLDIEYKELQKKIAIVNELQAKQEKIKARLATINKLNANRDFWENVIVEFSNKLPGEFISFKSFFDQSDEERRMMRVDGVALSDQYVADYIESLKTSSLVTTVTLASTKAATYMGREARSFNILVFLKTPADTSKGTLGEGLEDEGD